MVDCFDISQLPSLKLGMTIEEEALQRRKTCRFIEESGKVLSLPRVAVATAMVMFHRFYAKHTFQDHDRFEVAVACIVLAAKTEESPKKLNTVILECYKLKMTGMKTQAANNKSLSITPNHSPNHPSSNRSSILPIDNMPSVLDIKSEEFNKLKEHILLLERVILHTIGFELSIDHPYKFLIDQIRDIVITKSCIEFIINNNNEADDLNNNKSLTTIEMTKKLHQRLLQTSMNFANDSMHTSLCLQFDPKQIATACIFLGCHFAKIQPIPKQKQIMKSKNNNSNNTTTSSNTDNDVITVTVNDWLEILKYPNINALSSISLQILELIAERKGCDVTLLETIRTLIEQFVIVSNNNNNDNNNDQSVVDVKNEQDDTSSNNNTSNIVATDTDQPDAKRQRMKPPN